MLCQSVLSVRELSHFYGIIACRYFICMTLYVFLKVSTVISISTQFFQKVFIVVISQFFSSIPSHPLPQIHSSSFIISIKSFYVTVICISFLEIYLFSFFLNLWYLLTVQIMDLIIIFTCIYMMYVIFTSIYLS